MLFPKSKIEIEQKKNILANYINEIRFKCKTEAIVLDFFLSFSFLLISITF